MDDPFGAWVVRGAEPAARGGDGPLAGIRFGVKDIIDVAGLPTAHGVDFAVRRPDVDAWCVAALRAAGAVPAGKTVTTPFAYRDPAPTRNPRNPAHTPGGSSAGSAAAVAAGDVPLALGTQTLGSILRPAAFCGIAGFKPTWGRIPTNGVSGFAPSLDTLGFLAADVATARAASEALFALEPPRGGPFRVGLALAYMREVIDDRSRAAIERAVGRLRAAGIDAGEAALPACVEESVARASHVQSAEGWASLGAWIGAAALPPLLAQGLAEGKAIEREAYRESLAWRERRRPQVEAAFAGFDAVLMPCANLAPPMGTTGDPSPLSPWTFFGFPAISLPIEIDPASGLSYSVQAVAVPGADARLLEAAAAIEALLAV